MITWFNHLTQTIDGVEVKLVGHASLVDSKLIVQLTLNHGPQQIKLWYHETKAKNVPDENKLRYRYNSKMTKYMQLIPRKTLKQLGLNITDFNI